MADSFFGFNTTLDQGLELVDEPELDEEEYDALNDETFGADAFQGDWEEDHTRFAEVTENSRTHRNSFNSDKDDDLDLEASLSQLVLDGEEEGENEDEDKKKTKKSNKIPDRFLFDYIGGFSSSTWSVGSEKSCKPSSKHQHPLQPQKSQPMQPTPPPSSATHILPPQLPRIPTVQELERDLIVKNKQSKYVDKENKLMNANRTINHEKVYLGSGNQNSNNQFQHQNKISHSGSNKVPPGFGPQQGNFNQPQQQEMVMLRNNQNVPPLQLGPLLLPSHVPMLLSPHILPPHVLPPHMLPSHILPPPASHPLLLAQNPRLLNPHSMMRFMHPLLMQQQLQQPLQKQKQKLLTNQDQLRNGQAYRNQNAGHSHWSQPIRRNNDEYAGLMTNRERQWLLNIRILQLATDKPHVEDYYYQVWSKKKEKEMKLKEEMRDGATPILEPFFANNRKNEGNRERSNSDREITATPSPRVYVPLQFENSLGKLQCGSVTAPRKIIDLDFVPERQLEATPNANHRDSRKTKKILLELEQLYLLAMDVEDIENDVKLEPSQPEEPPPSKAKLLEQLMNSYLNEERFVNFICIRKGKNLLLRVLPHLDQSDHYDHLTNLWCRLIESISVIVRRDQNDGILLQIYPYFKTWLNAVDSTVLSVIASYLLTANIPNTGKKSSRAVSPNSKSVLTYILTTTFGASVVTTILLRGEELYEEMSEKDKAEWKNFILNFIKHMTSSPNLENQIPTPLDPLPANVLTVILNRSTGLQIQDYASAKRLLAAFNKDERS